MTVRVDATTPADPQAVRAVRIGFPRAPGGGFVAVLRRGTGQTGWAPPGAFAASVPSGVLDNFTLDEDEIA